MNNLILLLGGNLNDRFLILDKAKSLLEKKIGKIIKASSVYETEPWGFNNINFFLNQVVLLKTKLTPHSLLSEILEIEHFLGRLRNNTNYESRIIDIDILFYDDLIINENNLTVPHPLLHKRKFTLIPLKEVAKNFIHPVFKKTISELSDSCNDKQSVKLYECNQNCVQRKQNLKVIK
ncbi:MAG: 2-amino-4-hydroxy-6-hydroxymethyldihydropteridine diphosphokinase [Bacteroidales bacterium]|nr:2-amino-4-hydroxy-6-hydroxymethyldihydropteridine diphosphokinase [Bacteroidales bacterium]